MTSSFALMVVMAIVFIASTLPITTRYLQFFQQEEYDDARYLKWFFKTFSIEKRATVFLLLIVLLFVIFIIVNITQYIFMGVTIISLLIVPLLSHSHKHKSSKKNLVFTARAKRIFNVTLFMQITFLLVLFACFIGLSEQPFVQQFDYLPFLMASSFVILLICFLFIPFSLVVANRMLSPYEYSIQQRFLNEAKEKLEQIDPNIIGITGSYGKTSIKHILSHILGSHEPTLATPGSVNTQMGITRIIREKLRPEHQHFIVEMGAYGIGSIKRLCDLTPPKVAIVTAVGMAHYERFKSVKTVQKAKSELPQALPAEGMAILNGDNPYVREMGQDLKTNTYYYGQDKSLGQLDCVLKSTQVNDQGTSVVLVYEGQEYQFQIPIHGKQQAMNVAGAFLTAVKLGVPILTIQAALKSLPPIEHRLVVKRDSSGITIVDDAYNSNPDGFASALEVLSNISGDRKILVTPGMVELGKKHDEEHRKIALQAAKVCDLIILIAPQRIPTFQNGLKEANYPEDKIQLFQSLQEAREFLNDYLKAGDVVLYENDLPDLYESQSAFNMF